MSRSRWFTPGSSHLALIRGEELDGFVEGQFGKEQSLELPERAHRALDALSELRAIFDGLYGARPSLVSGISTRTNRNGAFPFLMPGEPVPQSQYEDSQQLIDRVEAVELELICVI